MLANVIQLPSSGQTHLANKDPQISEGPSASPSVSEWWRIVSLYTDQTGANLSRLIFVAGEYADICYSHGAHLTHKNGIYSILTSSNVKVQYFYWAVCKYH
ncbi:hypothetical protein HHK36_022414 [Tetracentron sinense]|uniref:Uncharacterized protein n=1 Tax=Tetracentron sinense TaxID=13715 RepID=A0A835D628_TETSI|nr:hypothetical protein HHK36_022414 [Tetracentron sinense]